MANKKTTSKRQKDIKSKLVAAVCMLLVSSIMMVSSTYAWFTLSTAPEVTGINTQVGANGNLEMALLPADGDLDKISTAAGDSVKADIYRNITWGNLVDVSDDSYGLENIVLFPAAVNMDGTKLNMASVLKTPFYGADGRVADLRANTCTGIYNSNNGSFVPDDNAFGVRAVGTASGMTDRELSYRNARNGANSAAAKAAQLASASLTANGGALADLAIKKGTSGNAAQFTQENVDSLKTIVNDLQKADGILAQIENAYMQYILAYAASAANEAGDEAWSAVKNLVEAENATLKSVLDGLSTVSLPEAVNTAIAKFNDFDASDVDSTVDKVASAKDKLDALAPLDDTKTYYSWSELSPILTALANPDAMEVNDIKAGEIMQDDNMSALVNSVTGGKGLTVTMKSGGGVYADIADQCGDYKANVNIAKITYNGLSVGPIAATMDAKSTAIPVAYLTAVGSAVEAAGAPASAQEGDLPISDTFGYVIDMAFRTNAADSDLLLQQTGVDRIYASNESGVENKYTVNGVEQIETTMGGGAYMEYNPTTNSFGTEKITNLMDAVRIVFFDPTSGDIYAYAKLDTSKATATEQAGLRAPIALYTVTTAVSYVEATGEEATHYYDEETQSYKAADATNAGTHKEVTGAKTETISESMKIMSLNQNTPTKLSVLVYLDGEKITNADVAATAATSVTGSMNLQFASSATLVPMDYTPLQNQGTTPAGSEGN